MEQSQIIDTIVFILFHAFLFYCWRRIILFLRKENAKYLKLAWMFIALYWFLFFLVLYIGSIKDGVEFIGIKIPVYPVFGLILLSFSIRIIPPIKAEVLRRIKKLVEKNETV